MALALKNHRLSCPFAAQIKEVRSGAKRRPGALGHPKGGNGETKTSVDSHNFSQKNINNRQSLDNPHIWDISTSTSVKYLQIAILGIPHFLLANSNKYRTFLLLIYPKSI